MRVASSAWCFSDERGDGGGGRSFFLSVDGNDANDGRSPETAWATLARLATAHAAGEIRFRDIISFRRGDEFFGKVVERSGLTLQAYGVGPRPIISGYFILDTPTAWTLHAANVWRLDLRDTTARSGNPSSQPFAPNDDGNIGFLKTDGVLRTAKKKTIAALTALWDFHSDGTYLYIYAPSNPSDLVGDLRAAPNVRLVTVNNNLTVTGLHLQGTGGHGIRGMGNTALILDNEISEIGGSYLPGYGDGTVRYGNGVEGWVGASDWVVRYNTIREVYDVAFTLQGTSHSSTGWKNILVSDNTIYDCNQSFEFWSQGTPVAGGGFVNVVLEDNDCERAGYSAFSDVRPDQSTRVHLLTYSWELPADITVRRNRFYDAHGAYRHSAYPAIGMVAYDNIISLKPGHLMQTGKPQTIADAAAWATANNTEVGSTFEVI